MVPKSAVRLMNSSKNKLNSKINHVKWTLSHLRKLLRASNGRRSFTNP